LLYKGGKNQNNPVLERAQEVIKISNDIGEGDPMHPLATNVFSKEIKRVQVIYN